MLKSTRTMYTSLSYGYLLEASDDSQTGGNELADEQHCSVFSVMYQRYTVASYWQAVTDDKSSANIKTIISC